MEEGVKEEEVVVDNKCGLKVLVVDDSPVDRSIVERLLKKSGELFEGIVTLNLTFFDIWVSYNSCELLFLSE